MTTLVNLLEQLMSGSIDIETAGRRAEDVTAGEMRQTSIGRTRVLRPTREVQHDLADLQAEIRTLPPSDLRKWAGTFLMLRAQLGVGIANNAIGMILQMTDGTQGRYPEAARPYVAAMFDATLAAIPDTHTDVIADLVKARQLFRV